MTHPAPTDGTTSNTTDPVTDAAALRQAAERLRAEADRIESTLCTGIAAVWCPVHGDCTCHDGCDDREFGEHAEGCLWDRDNPECALHSAESAHGDHLAGAR